MSDSLKIMVRTEEVREVSTEFRCVVQTYSNRPTSTLGIDAGGILDSAGYVQGTLGWDVETRKWVAKFRTLREATADERDAWHTLAQTKIPVNCLMCSSFKRKQANASAFLKDKEIILEVVRGDAHDN